MFVDYRSVFTSRLYLQIQSSTPKLFVGEIGSSLRHGRVSTPSIPRRTTCGGERVRLAKPSPIAQIMWSIMPLLSFVHWRAVVADDDPSPLSRSSSEIVDTITRLVYTVWRSTNVHEIALHHVFKKKEKRGPVNQADGTVTQPAKTIFRYRVVFDEISTRYATKKDPRFSHHFSQSAGPLSRKKAVPPRVQTLRPSSPALSLS